MFTNIKKIVTAQFILLNLCFMIGFSPVFFFYLFPLHLKALGAESYQIGIAMGLFSVGGLIVKPFCGRWLGEIGRRRFGLIGYLIAISSIILMCFFNTVFPFYPLRFFFGIGISVCMTSLYTIMLDLAPTDMKGQTVGLFGIANFIVAGTSTAIGEIVIRHFGFQMIFYISILNLLLSLMLFTRIKDCHPPGKGESIPFFRTMLGPVRAYLVAVFMFSAAHGSLFSFIALYLRENNFSGISLFFIFYSLGAIILRVFFGHLVDRVSKPLFIAGSFTLYSVTLVVLAFYPEFIVVLLLAFIAGISHGFLFPALTSGVISAVGERWHATGASIFFLVFDGGMGIAPFLFGLLSGLTGFGGAYLVLGVFLFIYSLISYNGLMLSEKVKSAVPVKGY